MDFAAKFPQGLTYDQFLERHANAQQRANWERVHAAIALSAAQRQLLGGFQRDLKVLVLAGAWCGDCVEQCPIFDHFAAATDRIQLRLFDRDAHPDLQQELTICGGARVPVAVFLSEDDQEVGRYGDRTLAKYRQLAASQLGAACPTGIAAPQQPLLDAVVEEWLDEFERAQLLLRTSPRLRTKHGD